MSVGGWIGAPGTGKTTAALVEALRLASSQRKRLLIMDCGGSRSFDNYQGQNRADSKRRVLNLLYSKPDSIVAWTPSDWKEYDAILGVVLSMKNCVILIDEISIFGITPNLKKIGRTHRHGAIDLLVTTQNLTRDVGSEASSWEPDLFIFRLRSGPNVDFVSRYFGIPNDDILNLQNFFAYNIKPGTNKPALIQFDHGKIVRTN